MKGPYTVWFLLVTSLVTRLGAIDLPPFGGGGSKGATRNVFVSFTSGTNPILDAIASRSFANREDRLAALTSGLQSHAALTQGPIINFLGSPAAKLAGSPLSFKSFWISNELFLEGAPSGLLNLLQATFPSQIASIEDERFAHIDPIVQSGEVTEDQSTQSSPQWGVERIQAHKVHEMGINGNGVVVGVIDTGVMLKHPALEKSWVGNGRGNRHFAWYDPGNRWSTTPSDGNGHGTHCTGTVLGTLNGIGVAPGAKWMACRGCSTWSCSFSHLKDCCQYMLCPHEGDPKRCDSSKAPHIVSNSWGGGNGDKTFDSITKAWKTAGIVGVFAIGNSGRDGCGSANSPGDGFDVIGVGSIKRDGDLSDFSSQGPGRDQIKPDISAPGSDVTSSWNNGGYRTISGTSMACPHVAGVAALMLSANPKLTPEEVEQALYDTVTTSNLKNRQSRQCGSDRGWTFPNNQYGHGLVNALNAVNLVK